MTPRCTKEEHELKEVVRSSGKGGVDKHVTLMMEYDFFAEDGSKVTVGPLPAEGLDSGDKATNKALSAALKYALIQTFSVPTEDMAEADLDSLTIGSTKAQEAPKAASKPALVATPVAQSPTPVATTPVAPTEAPKTSSFKAKVADMPKPSVAKQSSW